MSGGEAGLLRAARGAATLITLGTLFALDHLTAYEFWRTWPLILIVYGLFSLGGGRRA